MRYNFERARRVIEQNTIKATRIKEEIDRDLPPGTAKASVDRYLRTHRMQDIVISSSSYMVHVAHGPTDVWFCGSSDVWVEIVFAEEHLVKTSVSNWSGDCL